jgi:hypothetical protein
MNGFHIFWQIDEHQQQTEMRTKHQLGIFVFGAKKSLYLTSTGPIRQNVSIFLEMFKGLYLQHAFAPRGKLCPLGGLFTPRGVNTLLCVEE